MSLAGLDGSDVSLPAGAMPVYGLAFEHGRR